MWVHVHMLHTCLWRSEVNSEVIPQIPSTLGFFFFCKIKSLFYIWLGSLFLLRRQLPLPSAGCHQDSAAQIRTAEVVQSVLLCSSAHCCLEAGYLTEPSALSARLVSLWAFRIHLSLPSTYARVRNMPRFLSVYSDLNSRLHRCWTTVLFPTKPFS